MNLLPPGVASAGPSGVPLRRMTPTDLAFVSDLHRQYFPENVVVRLGSTLLRRYYATFLDSPLAIAVVAEVDGRSCGYLVGVLDTVGHRSATLRSHGWALALACVGATLAHPRLAVQVLVRRLGLRRPPRPAPDESVPPVDRTAVLSHVVVLPEARKQGVGALLVDAFRESAYAAGADLLTLATSDEPDGPHRFYCRLGWRPVSRARTADGRSIRIYEYQGVSA